MNADRLLALYDRVAEAPNAIPRLRRFVLDLAVRGKLVEHDPADKPEPELLKKVPKQRSVLGDIPSNWRRAELGELLDLRYGKGLKASERLDEGPVPVFGSNGIVGYSDAALTDKPAIIIGRKGSAGALNICDGPSWTTDVAYYVEAPSFFVLRFLLIAISALDLNTLGKGVKPGLNRNDVYELSIKVPPLAEQRRIVAKVDELMALCDRLETTKNNREIIRNRLTAASLAYLTASHANDASFRTHARFALDVLPSITTRLDHVKNLRQTILNLAVRGKLVEHDRADETASELLKRIAGAKIALGQATRDRRIKLALGPVVEDYPCRLPTGWCIQSFENLFLFIDYRGRTPPKTAAGVPLITAKNVRMGTLKREPREFIAKGTYQTWMTRGLPARGDLFFTTEAPLANVCLNDIEEPFALAQRVICLQPYGEVNTRYCMFAIMSDVMQNLIVKHATGLTAKGIKAAKLKPLPIPVPPLAEQNRIVAKIDALMALCDRLERSLHEAEAGRRRLLEALLQEALLQEDLLPTAEALEAVG